MQKKLLSSCSFFIILFCLLLMVNGAAAASVKDRMAARIPQLNTMKNQGAIGENNLGYLEIRDKSKTNAQLIAEENNDRKLVYEAIAKKQKANPALVGKRRAKMIKDKGQPGHWFQKNDGSWYKK